MEFLTENYLNTTSMMQIDSLTGTGQSYILDPDSTLQYISGNAGILTATGHTIIINFDETLLVEEIIVNGLNSKNLQFTYDYTAGGGGTLFSLSSSDYGTNTTSWSTNSETALFLRVSPVYCTSVAIFLFNRMDNTADSRTLGYFYIGRQLFDFSQIPSAKNYTPILEPKQVVHNLSDGNIRLQNISNKWKANIKLNYATETVRNSLKEIYDQHNSMVFVPFGTGTSWDGVFFPCVWEGAFEFFKYSDNAPSAGFEGSIKLRETTPV